MLGDVGPNLDRLPLSGRVLALHGRGPDRGLPADPAGYR